MKCSRVHCAVTDTAHHPPAVVVGWLTVISAYVRCVSVLCMPLWVCRWLMAAGKRPVPFRTRKLSPPALMVLLPGGSGRVGYRRRLKLDMLWHPPPHRDGPVCGLVWSAGVPFLYARGVKIDTGVLVTCADTAPDASYRQLLHWGRISEPLRIVRWGYKARFLEGVYGWSKQQPGRLVW